AHDEAYARRATLDAVITELLGIFLGPGDEFVVTLRRIGNESRVVGKCGLAVEHRHHITVDISAERHLRIFPRHQLAAIDLAPIIFEELCRYHRSDKFLVDDSDVCIPLFHASLGLGFETFKNLLRACIAGTCSDHTNCGSGIFLLEQWSKILIDVIDHILVARCDDGKFVGSSRCNGEADCHCRIQDRSHEKGSCLKPEFSGLVIEYRCNASTGAYRERWHPGRSRPWK